MQIIKFNYGCANSHTQNSVLAKNMHSCFLTSNCFKRCKIKYLGKKGRLYYAFRSERGERERERWWGEATSGRPAQKLVVPPRAIAKTPAPTKLPLWCQVVVVGWELHVPTHSHLRHVRACEQQPAYGGNFPRHWLGKFTTPVRRVEWCEAVCWTIVWHWPLMAASQVDSSLAGLYRAAHKLQHVPPARRTRVYKNTWRVQHHSII